MTNKPQQSPTPWRVIHATLRESEEINIECRFENGEKYAAIQVCKDKPELAEHVLRSILNHDVLVEALKAVLKEYECEKEVLPAYYQARQALNNAKGE